MEAEVPELTALTRRFLDSHVHKTLVTLRHDGSPRISGTEVTFADGELWLGSMWRAVKALDLRRDPRFALHSGSADPPGWTGDAKLGTLVVSNSNFETAQDRALFAGTVMVRGGDNEDADSVDVGEGSCIDGYANAMGTITIAGEVRRAGSASEARPGYFDVRLWSWRELYE